MQKWIFIFLISFTSIAQQQVITDSYYGDDYSKAVSLFESQQYDRAKPIFETYLKEHPNHYDLMRQIITINTVAFWE